MKKLIVGRKTSLMMILWFCLMSVGCGIQFGTGLHANAPQTSWPQTLELTSRVHLIRENGVFGGADLEFSDPEPESDFALRHLRTTVGCRLLYHPVVLEIAPELALGEPAFKQFQGSGMYGGLSFAALFRIMGNGDARVGFVPAAVLMDFVATGRGGIWSPPYSSNEDMFWDASIGVGLRFTLISDLTVAASHEWEER